MYLMKTKAVFIPVTLESKYHNFITIFHQISSTFSLLKILKNFVLLSMMGMHVYITLYKVNFVLEEHIFLQILLMY